MAGRLNVAEELPQKDSIDMFMDDLDDLDLDSSSEEAAAGISVDDEVVVKSVASKGAVEMAEVCAKKKKKGLARRLSGSLKTQQTMSSLAECMIEHNITSVDNALIGSVSPEMVSRMRRIEKDILKHGVRYLGPQLEAPFYGLFLGWSVDQSSDEDMAQTIRCNLVHEKVKKQHHQVQRTWLELFTDLIFVAVIVKFANQMKENFKIYTNVQDSGRMWLTFYESVIFFVPFFVVWLELNTAMIRFADIEGGIGGVLDDGLLFLFMVGITLLTTQIQSKERLFDEIKSRIFIAAMCICIAALLALHILYRWKIPSAKKYCTRRIISNSIALAFFVAGFVPQLTKAMIVCGTVTMLYTALLSFKVHPYAANKCHPLHKVFQIPTITMFANRFGIFTMIVLGESMLAVMIDPEITGARYLIVAPGFLMIYMLKLLYFDSNTTPEGHALNEGEMPGSCMWVFLHLPLGYFLLLLGTGMKLLFFTARLHKCPWEFRLITSLSLSIVIGLMYYIRTAHETFIWTTISFVRFLPLAICPLGVFWTTDSFDMIFWCLLVTAFSWLYDYFFIEKYETMTHYIKLEHDEIDFIYFDSDWTWQEFMKDLLRCDVTTRQLVVYDKTKQKCHDLHGHVHENSSASLKPLATKPPPESDEKKQVEDGTDVVVSAAGGGKAERRSSASTSLSLSFDFGDADKGQLAPRSSSLFEAQESLSDSDAEGFFENLAVVMKSNTLRTAKLAAMTASKPLPSVLEGDEESVSDEEAPDAETLELQHDAREEEHHEESTWFGEFSDLIFVAVIINFADQFKKMTTLVKTEERIVDLWPQMFGETLVYFVAFFALWYELSINLFRFTDIPGVFDDVLKVLYLFGVVLMGLNMNPKHHLFYHFDTFIFGMMLCVTAFLLLHLLYYKNVQRAQDYCRRRMILYAICVAILLFTEVAMGGSKRGHTTGNDPARILAVTTVSFLMLFYSSTSFRVVQLVNERGLVEDYVFPEWLLEHVSERWGLLIMITTGESILALVTSSDEDFLNKWQDFYVIVCAFAIMYLMKDIYFNSSNVRDAHHALNLKKSPGSVAWTLIHGVLAFWYMMVGTSWKLLFFSLKLELRAQRDKDNGKDYDESELNGRVWFFWLLSVSQAMCFGCCYLIRMTHAKFDYSKFSSYAPRIALLALTASTPLFSTGGTVAQATFQALFTLLTFLLDEFAIEKEQLDVREALREEYKERTIMLHHEGHGHGGAQHGDGHPKDKTAVKSGGGDLVDQIEMQKVVSSGHTDAASAKPSATQHPTEMHGEA